MMESASVHCRLAVLADVPSIVALLADDALGAARERVEQPTSAVYYDAFDAIAGDPNIALLVAECAGAIVGTLQLTFTPGLSRQGSWRATLEAVRVSSAHRGSGIGAILVNEAVARARAKGCRIVQLTTDKRRPDAQRFYARLGFVDSHVGMKLDIATED